MIKYRNQYKKYKYKYMILLVNKAVFSFFLKINNSWSRSDFYGELVSYCYWDKQ